GAGEASPRPSAPERVVSAPTRNGPTPRGDGRVPVKAAPSVRLLARKLGIDLAAVPGSGPDGRILVEDLSARVPKARGGNGVKPPAEPKADYGRPGTRIKLHGLRRTIAERMAQAKRTIPDYSYVSEYAATALVPLRAGLRPTLAAAGAKLTYLPVVVKAVVGALVEMPIVNSSLNEAGDEIVLHDHYHIGIAVATPAGLIVPVIRDADKKDIATPAPEIERLGNDAPTGPAKLDDLPGGTVTVTSVGQPRGLVST